MLSEDKKRPHYMQNIHCFQYNSEFREFMKILRQLLVRTLRILKPPIKKTNMIYSQSKIRALAIKLLHYHYDFILADRYDSILRSAKCSGLSSEKTVYFPLQYQPEASTHAFGGVYEDQIIALEWVSAFIPPDWKILTKEHPNRSSMHCRGELFIQRLLNVPKVELINPDVVSKELIDTCSVVATVNGSAGWEAIRRMKPVIAFGNAWYKTFPGVYHYDEIVRFEDIFQEKWSLDDIEHRFNQLTKKMGRGFVSDNYLDAVDVFNDFRRQRFDAEANSNKILESIKKILDSTICAEM